MNLKEIEMEKIEALRAERDEYKTLADLLQARLEETEEELKAAKGQLKMLRIDRRYEVA